MTDITTGTGVGGNTPSDDQRAAQQAETAARNKLKVELPVKLMPFIIYPVLLIILLFAANWYEWSFAWTIVAGTTLFLSGKWLNPKLDKWESSFKPQAKRLAGQIQVLGLILLVATLIDSSFFHKVTDKVDQVEKCLDNDSRECDPPRSTKGTLTIVRQPTPTKPTTLDPKVAAENCVLGKFLVDLDAGDVFIRHFQDTELYSPRAFDGKTFKAKSLVPANGRVPDKILNFGGKKIPAVWETGLGADKVVYMRRYYGTGQAIMIREAAKGKKNLACRPTKM